MVIDVTHNLLKCIHVAPSVSPQLNDIQFPILCDGEKQKLFWFQRLGPVIVWDFLLIYPSNNQLMF